MTGTKRALGKCSLFFLAVRTGGSLCKAARRTPGLRKPLKESGRFCMPAFLSYFSTKDVSEQDHSIAMLAVNVNKENEWRF